MKNVPSLRNRRGILAVITVLSGLAGCDDDGGPTDPPAGPDIVGQWSFTAAGEPQEPTTLFGSVVEVCVVEGLVLTFIRSGDTLEGTIAQSADAFLVCLTPDEEEVFGDLTGHSGPLSDIVLNGDNISFRQPGGGNTGYDVTGSLAADENSMEGTTTFTLSGFDGADASFEGLWEAERQ